MFKEKCNATNVGLLFASQIAPHLFIVNMGNHQIIPFSGTYAGSARNSNKRWRHSTGRDETHTPIGGMTQEHPERASKEGKQHIYHYNSCVYPWLVYKFTSMACAARRYFVLQYLMRTSICRLSALMLSLAFLVILAVSSIQLLSPASDKNAFFFGDTSISLNQQIKKDGDRRFNLLDDWELKMAIDERIECTLGT